jgi:hypothetical protein
MGGIVVLAVAAVVLVATVVQAVRERSWGPVLEIGWLPAVVVASLYRPRNRCRPGSSADG